MRNLILSCSWHIKLLPDSNETLRTEYVHPYPFFKRTRLVTQLFMGARSSAGTQFCNCCLPSQHLFLQPLSSGPQVWPSSQLHRCRVPSNTQHPALPGQPGPPAVEGSGHKEEDPKEEEEQMEQETRQFSHFLDDIIKESWRTKRIWAALFWLLIV